MLPVWTVTLRLWWSHSVRIEVLPARGEGSQGGASEAGPADHCGSLTWMKALGNKSQKWEKVFTAHLLQEEEQLQHYKGSCSLHHQDVPLRILFFCQHKKYTLHRAVDKPLPELTTGSKSNSTDLSNISWYSSNGQVAKKYAKVCVCPYCPIILSIFIFHLCVHNVWQIQNHAVSNYHFHVWKQRNRQNENKTLLIKYFQRTPVDNTSIIQIIKFNIKLFIRLFIFIFKLADNVQPKLGNEITINNWPYSESLWWFELF